MTLIYGPQNKKYSFEFEKQVQSFGDSLALWNEDSKILIALSGGEDSMALLYFFLRLKEKKLIKSVRAIHIHHGTRVSQDDEEKIVRLFCESLRVKLQVFYLHDLKDSKNFENEARLRRYDIFSKARLSGELIALGHHIDDSFEWSLMQGFKSSELASSLGIPVKRDNLIRPFLSVTKKQIAFYRKTYDLPYVKDPTNDQVQFERNYLRHNIIPEIAKKYPQYLKHYVRRQNELAKSLNLHLKAKKKATVTSVYDGRKLFLFYDKKEHFNFSVFKSLMKKMSTKRWRAGNQEEQIKKMLSSHKIGPMHLPEDLNLFVHANTIAVLPRKFTTSLNKNFSFQKLTLKEFEDALSQLITTKEILNTYPLFVGAKSFEKEVRTYKKHSLVPNLDTYLNHHQLKLTDAFSLVEWWSRPNNRKKELSLTYLW